MSPEQRQEILKNVHIDGGTPTDSDLVEIDKFKKYLGVLDEARKSGIPKNDAKRIAGMEIYGNANCE